MKKKIVVAMSGGVDSSVTAAMLQEQGYECIGMHLHFWSAPRATACEPAEKFPQNKCCTVESLEDARKVAHKLGIPFYVMNVEAKFKEKVVDYFLDTYREAKTPNPCVECNRNIKFGEFLKRARELGADYLATGHYVRRVPNNGHYELWMAKDKIKDQSYFLYHLTQEKLAHVLFPLGDYLKSEVYELADRYGFPFYREKKESQGVCFFSERSPKEFLKRYLKSEERQPGPIQTLSGEVIGMHEGLPFYTVGQRQGLGIGGTGSAYYVVKLDRERNTVVVGREEDLMKESLEVERVHLICPEKPKEKLRVSVRIRHRFVPAEGWFSHSGDDRGFITFDTPQRAIAPGQAAVFYDHEKVLGGGRIVK